MARPKGSPNKATALREKTYALQGILPLDYMLRTLRDEERDHKERFDAAVAAAPYVHPKLQSVVVKGDPNEPLRMVDAVDFAALSQEQRSALRDIADALITKRQAQRAIEDQSE